MTTVVRRRLILVSVIMMLGLFLLGCEPASERINGMLATLPVPETANLVARQDGVSQGSEDACSFPYVKLLYGTNEDFELVSEFFRTSLGASSWQIQSDDSITSDSLLWIKERAFRLYLDPVPDIDFSENIIANARKEYSTVYYVVIRYVDRLARIKCLGETE